MRVTLLSLLVATSSAFNANLKSISRVAPLNVAATMDWDDEAFLMQYAQDCASTGSCSLEDYEACLDNVIRIQSGCSSGSLVGSDVCDVDGAVELVANLREKICKETRRLSLLSTGNNILSVGLVGLFLAASMSAMALNNPDVAPITMQEWWWAVRDGYLPLMLREYYQNGGLAGASNDVIPFTMQEIWWSIRDGYLPTMLREYYTNGGFASDELVSTTVPFTPQEWSFAMQGGYLDTLIAQTVTEGGLSDVTDVDTLPLTPQEWVWSIQGGYFDTLVKSYFEKGGL